MERLFEFSHRKLQETPTDFIRYKYDLIKWQGHAFGLVGPRGVGKTTMLLQFIKKNLTEQNTLYVSTDHLYFSNHSLVELADRFVKMGGEHLFIDEIHKYAGWSKEIKQIIDSYSDLQVVISGSSILDIYQGMSDLSRRVPIYEMQGLSFREYLKLFHNIEVPSFTLEEILSHKAEHINIKHPLLLFHKYLQNGYYPFGMNEEFSMELMQVINQTIDVDIPQYAKMNVSVSKKLKHLLMIVAESVPFKPVMQKIADSINTSRNNISDYLIYMERAGLIAQLRDNTGGIRGLGKVEKVYLDNTNLAYTLSPTQTNVGNVRETFFMNQMRVNNNVMASTISDFQIQDIVFEIGGRKKGKRQIEAAQNGFIVKDDIEVGFANIVPLWTFGLNY